eukprot:1639786-Prymnesium_polylepis.3
MYAVDVVVAVRVIACCIVFLLCAAWSKLLRLPRSDRLLLARLTAAAPWSQRRNALVLARRVLRGPLMAHCCTSTVSMVLNSVVGFFADDPMMPLHPMSFAMLRA